MSQFQDFRALPFIAEAMLRHSDEMNGHNAWCIAVVQAVQAFGVDRNTVDACFERLIGISGSEILSEMRDRHQH
jgi:hypothetical protein